MIAHAPSADPRTDPTRASQSHPPFPGYRTITARFDGVCSECCEIVQPGQRVLWRPGEILHEECAKDCTPVTGGPDRLMDTRSSCSLCRGPVTDLRLRKRAGLTSHRAPDVVCRSCGWKRWPERKQFAFTAWKGEDDFECADIDEEQAWIEAFEAFDQCYPVVSYWALPPASEWVCESCGQPLGSGDLPTDTAAVIEWSAFGALCRDCAPTTPDHDESHEECSY
jgi:hypothetical protein